MHITCHAFAVTLIHSFLLTVKNSIYIHVHLSELISLSLSLSHKKRNKWIVENKFLGRLKREQLLVNFMFTMKTKQNFKIL